MKKVLLMLILFTAFDSNFAQKNTEPTIKVETSVTGQKACLKQSTYIRNGETIENNHVIIDIELQNAITNKSSLPTLLDKRGGTVGGYSIYQKSADSMKGRQMTAVGWGPLRPADYSTEGDSPSDWFMVLNENETLRLEQTKVEVAISYPDKYADYNDRDYFITFTFNSMNGAVYEDNNLSELRSRWSKIGYLWFNDLVTEPVLIHFPSLESLKVCKN